MVWSRLRSAVHLSLLVSVLLLSACGGGGNQPTAPVITAQPVSISTQEGEAATFSVTATGTAPLSYQWYRDGSAIAGAVGTSHALSATKLSDSGARFHAVVSSALGNATSQSALLTVRLRPVSIHTQPLATAVDDGTSVTLSVGVSGSEPISFQWMRNGAPIPDAKGSALAITAASLADDKAQFSVRASNTVGSVTSDTVTLTVRPVAPYFAVVPQAIAAQDGRTVAFTAKVGGTTPISLQWHRDGVPLPGATAETLRLNTSLADNGSVFHVTASNRYGSLSSPPVKLTVDPAAPDFVQQPSAASAVSGGTLAFGVRAIGTGPIAIRWQRSEDGYNWSDMPGAVGPSLQISDATLRWAKTKVRAVATNAVGNATSQEADATVVANLRLLAGSLGGAGFSDGSGRDARFGQIHALATDKAGNTYVADWLYASNLRKLSPLGEATTIAGTAKPNNAIYAIALDPSGVVYYSHGPDIIRLEADGATTLVAGSDNTWGYQDGVGIDARFSYITSMAFNASGELFVTDRWNCSIRKMTTDRKVTTLAGDPLYCVTKDGEGRTAGFSSPQHLVVDPDGNLLVAENSVIRKVTPTGMVSRWSGSYSVVGHEDGDRAYGALYYALNGMAYDDQGNLFLTDAGLVRRISRSGQVSTLAGSAWLFVPPKDGYGVQGAFDFPGVLAPQRGKNQMLVAEQRIGAIRTVSPDGTIGTAVGILPDIGTRDGAAGTARFTAPDCMQPTHDGAALLVDGQMKIRRVRPDGSVVTVAHNLPQYTSFSCAVSDRQGNIYVSATFDHLIYKITPLGSTQVLAGLYQQAGTVDGPGTSARLNTPSALTIDQAGNLYFGEISTSLLRRVSPAGEVTTVAGTSNDCGARNGAARSASFCYIRSLAAETSGSILITDLQGAIRRYDPATQTVSSVAGLLASPGYSDGSVARFDVWTSISVDQDGYIYAFDSRYSTVRRVSPNGFTKAVIGLRDHHRTTLGVDGMVNQPNSGVVLPNGHLLIVSEYGVLSDY